jgi:hypothetical protein
MLLKCPRCSRTNPSEALFCFNDGTPLGDPARQRGITDPARQRFPMPFVFPSGKVCNTFDELALAIQADWDAAREMLRDDVFAGFLAGVGRADLSRAAREAAKEANADRALDGLLRALPSNVVEFPRLAVEPAKVNLGSVRVGQNLRFDLHVSNLGMGLLTGEVACEDGPWLVLGDGAARSRKKLFQTLHETTIPVHVTGKSLAAGNKPLVARLVIDSVGGSVQVPVTLEVPVTPFPPGPFGGAVTPRQVAQKARDNPKDTAELFARGDVERWYQSNGWTYPVLEPSAIGLAGVQQFFEALGLTTPPRVAVSDSEMRLSARGGDIVRFSLQVTTEEKKPVFAHATSDQDWLAVGGVELDGRTATVHLRIDEVPDRNGQTLRANVAIISNGRQRFRVPVYLTVTGPSPVVYSRHDAAPPVRETSRATPPPVDYSLPAEEYPEEKPRRKKRRRRDEPSRHEFDPRYLLAAIPVAFLMLGLLITFVADLRAWSLGAGGGPGDLAGLDKILCVHFHDEDMPVADGRAVWEPTMRFGLDLCGGGKKLTFDERGLTNNTVVRLDGAEWLFGQRPLRLPNGRELEGSPGRWLERAAPAGGSLRDGVRSAWVYDQQQVQVTQTVGLVPGAQSAKVDTCLVHYRIDNKDSRSHTVGLRFLLDTFIGDNDGVPFLIPGSKQLCNTFREFAGSEVPDFIQARETEDLSNPGTIATIQLKMPGQEPPSRVTLGAWPDERLGGVCRGLRTLWLVPALPMKTLDPSDSAVTIYWDAKPIPQGGSREMAFAYGLGSVAAGEAGGALGISVGGSFTPGGEFTLTAEARDPRDGQTLTLELPDGFSLVAGQPTQPVPPLAPNSPARTSPVTWRVKSGSREGSYSLRVRSSTGVSQTQPVRIRVRGIFGN